MKRVVITGMGAISPLGVTHSSIQFALEHSVSGVHRAPQYEDYNFACQVHAPITAELPVLNKKQMRFMGEGNTLLYGYHAMQRAVDDAGLSLEDIHSPRVGCILGTGGPSTLDQTRASDIMRETGPKKIGPFSVVPTMSSGLAAKVAVDFGLMGINFATTSACASSAHAIGVAAMFIQSGHQDIVFAGGSEDCDPTKACGFDAMRALSSKFNDSPEVASRAFDRDRDGFVDGAGGAVLVLEEYEHARARGANIYAELVGFGATSDGADMVAPSGEGAERCMRMALSGYEGNANPRIDYVNTHCTSTPVGDRKEVEALSHVFTENIPWINSTKSLSGHSLGAAGALEAVYTILQLRAGMVAASAHIDNLDPEIVAMGAISARIARETVATNVEYVLSNSFGFGGTNASLVFKSV